MSDAELERAQTARPEERHLDLIWAAMMGAVVVYAALAFTVVDSFVVTLDRELEGWILVFLAMTSGLHALVMLLLRQLVAALSRGNYLTYCVVRWALAEGIGVYGLVLALLGVGIGVTSIFFAVSLLLLAASKAGPTDRAVFVSQFR